MRVPCSAANEALNERLAGIVDAFYDLRFDEASAGARSIEKEFPGHPAGPFYAGMVHYQRYLIEDPPSDATLKSFEAEFRRAAQACENVRAKDPASAERYLGALSGFHARVLIAQGHYAAALPKARNAVKHLRRAVELDPADEDALFGLGMYDYFLSRVPAAAKPFSYLIVGMWGDRERGLKRLKRAADGGGPSRMEARSVLAALLGSDREKRWDEAQSLLDELAARYPGNPMHRLRAVYVAERRGDYRRALSMADPDGAWLDRLEPSIRDRSRREARLRAEEAARLLSGRHQDVAPFRWPLPALPES